jgi:hypothetical protein
MPLTPNDPAKAQVWVHGSGTDADPYSFDFYFPRGSKGDPGGIVQSTVLAAGTDMNNVTTPGMYRTQAGTLAGNHPQEGLAANVMVSASGTGLITQVAYPLNGALSSRVVFFRSYNTNAWHPWRVYSSQRVDQTAGRAIYTWDDVNAREQLVYGDTGLRTLQTADWPVNTPAITGGVMRLRRVGYLVDMDVTALSASTAGTVTFGGLLPAGFRPTTDRRVLGFSEVNGGQKLVDVRAAGSVTVQSFADTADRARVFAQFTTTDAWPASLPGAVYSSPSVS